MKSTHFRVLLSVIVIAVGLLVVNCASIIHGTKQYVSITSAPEQAKVEITTTGGIGVFSGTTPASARLKRKHEYKVEISLEGYTPQTMMIDKAFDPWVIGNLLCGGIIGLIIDATNGAMYQLEPEMIHVELVLASTGKGEAEIYAVCRTMNAEGELQTIVIPMIKK